MTCSVFIASSIDGFIATKDDGLQWLEAYENPSGSDHGYSEFMRRIDAIVMGRRTYEVVLDFGSWPYEVPVYVLSSTHSDDTRVQFVKGGARAAVQAAEANGHERLYVDGGKTIQGFLEADLIDEMIITTIPIVLGSGVPLFASAAPSRQFSVNSVRQLGPFIQSHFTRRREL